MINSWTSNYVQSQYSVFVDPEWKFRMEYLKLILDYTSIEHRRPSINSRSPLPSTNCVTKETISQSANSESFRAKMGNTPTYFPALPGLYLVDSYLCVHANRKKYATSVKWAPKVKLFQPMSRFSLYPRLTYGMLETTTREKNDLRWTSACRSSVTLELFAVASNTAKNVFRSKSEQHFYYFRIPFDFFLKT